MYIAAESPSAEADYDRKWLKPKVWLKKNFTFGRSRILAKYAQQPTFGRIAEAEAELWTTTTFDRPRAQDKLTIWHLFSEIFFRVHCASE